MNFFEHQDAARKQTKKLLMLFAGSVLTLVMGVYLAAIFSLNQVAPSLLNSSCSASLAAAPIGPSMVLLAQHNVVQPKSDAPPQLLAKRRSASSSFSSRSRRSYGTSYSTSYRQRSYRRPLACSITSWWQPHIFVCVGGGTAAVILLASLYKTLQLKSEGGGAIATAMGGRLLDINTRDASERMLLNVVEEMAIASGTPVPAVYVLDGEMQINAFAAGYTPNDAVIGVTRGSLETFSRDELQGVIGHEFSHILNGDMRMNIQLIGWIHGILCIYLVGRELCYWNSGDRDSDGNAFAYFGFALIVLGLSGLFFGRLMQSAISRQREYLADASAVQFTRNPEGIASALEKLADTGSGIQASYAQASSHVFFGSVLSQSWSAEMFATHPPLGQRIMRVRGLRPGDLAGHSAVSSQPSSVSNLTGAAGFAGAVGSSTTRIVANAAASAALHSVVKSAPARTAADLPEHVLSTSPEQLITQIGTVDPQHYDYAQGLLAQIPADLRMALRDSQKAMRVIYALMLDRENPFTYQQQVAFLQQVEAALGIEQVFEFHTQIKGLNSRLYLPLLDLAVPALRQLTAQESARLLKAVHSLANLDGQWTLAEFVNYLVLQHRLNPQPTGQSQVVYKEIGPVWQECLTLIAALARVGSHDAEAVTFAFRTGLYRLPDVTQNPAPTTLPNCNLAVLRKSLQKVRCVSPKLKQAIVDACSTTVMVDNKITIKQADLLRAIVILLDCPMPPFLDSERFVSEG